MERGKELDHILRWAVFARGKQRANVVTRIGDVTILIIKLNNYEPELAKPIEDANRKWQF